MSDFYIPTAQKARELSMSYKEEINGIIERDCMSYISSKINEAIRNGEFSISIPRNRITSKTIETLIEKGYMVKPQQVIGESGLPFPTDGVSVSWRATNE